MRTFIRGLLEVYNDIFKLINISSEEISYGNRRIRLQDLSIECIGEPILPLEKQSIVGQSAAAFNTTESGKQKYTRKCVKTKEIV